MRSKFGLIVATFFLLIGGLQSTGYAQRRSGGGGGFRGGGGMRVGGGFNGSGGIHSSGGFRSGGTLRTGGFRSSGEFRGGEFHEGFRRGGSRIIVSPGFGFGWGGWGYPYWGWNDPWYYSGYGYGYGYPVEVEHINYGTVDFKVKPDNTQVYIDQKLVGTVADLDHHKAYLPGGQHDIRLVGPNGQTIERSIFVAVGQKIKIEQRFGE